MRKRKIWFLVSLSLILILLYGTMLPSVEMVITSFPEILLGQVVLARETKPLPPRAYQSTKFLLNQVPLSDIERGIYIALYDDVLFGDPQYVGFPRTILNEGEISTLKQLLSTGNHFHQASDGNSHECILQSSSHEPKIETCPDGKQHMDQYLSYQWEAEQKHNVGVLQFFLTGGRLAEIRIYPSEQGLAYTPREIGGDRLINSVTETLPLLEELHARVSLPSISVLWPEITAPQANNRAGRIIGNRYQPAQDFIRNSPKVREVFGPILEIRPAAGLNYYSSWMDSTSVFLTFRIIGIRGEGAVTVQGYECFDLQMIFQGTPVDDGNTFVCP